MASLFKFDSKSKLSFGLEYLDIFTNVFLLLFTGSLSKII